MLFRSLRETKRIANNALSPIVTNASEATRGRLLGRILCCQDFFVQRHVEYMDTFLVAHYSASSIMQFSNLCTQILR